jgi:hypothetical protein
MILQNHLYAKDFEYVIFFLIKKSQLKMVRYSLKTTISVFIFFLGKALQRVKQVNKPELFL